MLRFAAMTDGAVLDAIIDLPDGHAGRAGSEGPAVAGEGPEGSDAGAAARGCEEGGEEEGAATQEHTQRDGAGEKGVKSHPPQRHVEPLLKQWLCAAGGRGAALLRLLDEFAGEAVTEIVRERAIDFAEAGTVYAALRRGSGGGPKWGKRTFTGEIS